MSICERKKKEKTADYVRKNRGEKKKNETPNLKHAMRSFTGLETSHPYIYVDGAPSPPSDTRDDSANSGSVEMEEKQWREQKNECDAVKQKPRLQSRSHFLRNLRSREKAKVT